MLGAMPRKAIPMPASICRLKITLDGSRPTVWRRVLVRADTTLDLVHRVIQAAMGWRDRHMHEFRVGEARYGPIEFGHDPGRQSEAKVTLRRVAPEIGAVFRYWYDFGDSWWHSVLLERVSPPDPAFDRPVCVGGKSACPPEDVGGMEGYREMLAALRNPWHRERESYLLWLGRRFEPGYFDVEEANTELDRIPWRPGAI